MSHTSKKSEQSKRIQALAIELVRGNMHLHFFKELRGQYSKLSGAKDFWDYTLTAHFGMGLLQLARIYDTHPKGLNIHNLLKTVNESRLDDEGLQLLKQYKRNCGVKEAPIHKLTIWRNNIIAHYNLKVALVPRDTFWKKFPIELVEINELTDLAFTILGWCALAEGLPETIVRLAEGADQYQRVIDSLVAGDNSL